MPQPRPDISVVHPFDPWSQGISGFDTFLDAFLRYAPQDWRIEVIGVSRDRVARPPGRRTVGDFHGRRLEFLPVLHDADPYVVRELPLSLRFAASARLRRVRPRGAVVQFHRFESLFGLGRRRGGRWVCFLHNHPPELTSRHSDRRWRRLGWLFRGGLAWSLARAEAVWAVDPRTPEWIAGFAPRLADSVSWLPVWADPLDFSAGDGEQRERDRSLLRRRLGLQRSDRICVFAGRLESQKNPLLLVDAFGELARREPRLFLLLVGSGRMRRAIAHHAVERGVSPRVRWLEGASRQELAAVYRGCDVSVCCSAYESGPRGVIESLACGCPAVSVDVGQAAAVLAPLSDLGLLVAEPGSAPLAAAIERSLAGDGDLAARCAAAVADATPQRALTPLYLQYSRWLESNRRE